jgi:hypothetical protein
MFSESNRNSPADVSCNLRVPVRESYDVTNGFQKGFKLQTSTGKKTQKPDK